MATRYNQLVNGYGLAPNEITTALAISQVLGPVDKAVQRREVDNLTSLNTGTYAEGGAGGPINKNVAGNALSKVPKELIADWKQTFPGTDQKTLEKWAQRHVEKSARRRGALGV